MDIFSLKRRINKKMGKKIPVSFKPVTDKSLIFFDDSHCGFHKELLLVIVVK